MLYGIGADNSQNLYAATTCLSAAATRQDNHFRALYQESFGTQVPPPNVFGRACYGGVHLMAQLAHEAGTVDGRTIARHLALLPRPDVAVTRHVHVAAVQGTVFA